MAKVLPHANMDRLIKTAVSGLAGTAVMTAGSELFSVIFKENFREPQHLETLISRLGPSMSKHTKTIAGWGAHVAVGFVFAAVYVELWENGTLKHNVKNALILGTLSGILGFLV